MSALVNSPPALRPYQIDVIDRLEAQIAMGRRRILLVAPTGAGKTVLASEIISRRVEEGALVLAHRRELITQTSKKLYDVGIDHGIIQAGFPTRPDVAVQVASVQTLHARAVRTSRIEPPPAGLVIVDEAHHAPADTYQAILRQYPDSILVGLTATPCRGDGRGLGKIFETMIECPQVAELIKGGYLVPSRVYAPSRPDLSGVKIDRGDYVQNQLAARVNTQQLVGDIVTHWCKLADRRKTVVFACGVRHSVHIRDQFRAGGIWAEHIDGTTPAEERDLILARLVSGSVDVVCNAMVLTEGWDCPSASCLILARPTKSLGLFRQMVGRVLRPYSGKIDALILDHAGSVFEHGLPEEPINWTLNEDERAENPVHRSRARSKRQGLTTCPECKSVRLEGATCNSCGWRPTAMAEGVEFADGELGRVDASGRAQPLQACAEERYRFHCMLLWFVARHDYNPGWAAHKFKERYGEWPPRHWHGASPVTPDDATRAWIRSRTIAWSKNRRAA